MADRDCKGRFAKLVSLIWMDAKMCCLPFCQEMHNTNIQQLSMKPDTCSIHAHETLWQCVQRCCRCALIAVPAMMPPIWPAALLGAGFWAGLLGPAASVEGAAAGLGALLANDGSCLASIHLTALHLWTQKKVTVLSVACN